MSEKFIPYGRQLVDSDDIRAVVEVLRSDFLTTGPAVRNFERALTRSTGARHAIAVSSGTSALHTAYFAAGLRPGDEIVTTPLTFAATANAALYLGATVVFADVDPDTGLLEPEKAEAAISSNTRIVAPVDYTGHPADYDRFREIGRRHSVSIVADAAHSLGATYRGRKVGTLADINIMSFHPVKLVTTAEGGAILTDIQTTAARAKLFRTHGITADPSVMEREDGPWHCEMHALGFNYRLSDVHSALGISQLKKLERFVTRRRQIAARYNDAFRDVRALRIPVVRDEVEPAWHLYVVRVAGDHKLRRPFFERLRELSLGVQLHYIPVHHHPYYQHLGFDLSLCPNAEEFSARALSLPIFPGMSDDDVDEVIVRTLRAVRDILE